MNERYDSTSDATPPSPADVGQPQPWPGERRDPAAYKQLLERLGALSQAMASARDLVTVYRGLRAFVAASAPCNGLYVSLSEPATGERRCVFAFCEGREEDVTQLPLMPLTASPSSRALRTGQIVVTEDFQAAIRGQPRVDLGMDLDPRVPQTAISVPMQVLGRTIGVFEIQSVEPRAYTDEHVTAMRMAASLAAIAIENVRLLERERAERLAAENARENYRLLFRNNPRPMWVLETETLRFLAVNDAAVRNYGYGEAEFLGMTLSDIRPAGDGPELTPGPGDALEGRAWHARHRKKDGDIIEVEIASDAIAFEGRPARLVVVQDVTDRVRAERARREAVDRLRQSESLLRIAGRTARVGAWVVDLPAMQVVWSDEACELLEIPPGTAMAIAEAFQFGAPESRETLMKAFAACAEEGLAYDLETESVTANGRRRWLHVIGEPERDAAGRICRVQGAIQDITDRKRLEAQFLRAQRLESIGTLAGGIAHDLNNLLAPITMSVDLLKLEATTADSRHLLDVIERSAKRSASLVKQVLSFARGVDGARVAVKLRALLQEVAAIVENTFPKNIELCVEVPEAPWGVTGDPTQLQQVVLNLCVNARDAMPRGGKLRIHLHNEQVRERVEAGRGGGAPGRYVAIDVADTGTGMPAEVIGKIFEPFFTTKPVGKGSGLGLATALGIVRSHKGFIEVDSEVGRGSTFRVFLPASAGESAPVAERSEPPLPRGRQELILVVDDESAILTVTRHTLELFGYRVLTAENGADAVRLVAEREKEIALVLLDMMMPVMDGSEAALAMRRLQPALRIVGASGLDAAAPGRAASAGIKRLLRKPFSTAELLTTVRGVLDER